VTQYHHVNTIKYNQSINNTINKHNYLQTIYIS